MAKLVKTPSAKILAAALSAALACLPQIMAQSPPVSWVRQSVSSDNVGENAVAVDETGNIYVVGGFNTTTTFGSVTINGAGGFLAKYDSVGNVAWALPAGGTNGDYDYNTVVATDNAGHVYVAGNFLHSAVFGNVVIANIKNSGSAAFVAEFDSDGNFLWAKPFIATNGLDLYGLVTDTNSNCYVTGDTLGPATFTTNLSNGGAGFVAKLDSSGNLLWVAPAGGVGSGIALDATGNVLVTGGYSGSAVWGNAPLQTNRIGDVSVPNLFLAKYDGAGNLLWVSGNADVTIIGAGKPLAIGGDGSAYIAYLQYPLETNSFISKYAPDGNVLWSKVIAGISLSSITVDSSNHFYAAGINQLPNSLGNYFLGRYDNSGNPVTTNFYGGVGSYGWPDMSISGDGQNIYLVGAFLNSVTFGPFTLTATNDTDASFLAAFNDIGEQPPILNLQIEQNFVPAVTIYGFVGNTYQIDFTDSLSPTNWQPWARFVLPSSPYTLLDPSPNPSIRLYRATLVQP